jgi:hypothetical protein
MVDDDEGLELDDELGELLPEELELEHAEFGDETAEEL